MGNSLAHRGPDASGAWVRGSVGLGHRMLWTTPESLHERLPFVTRTESLAITADARLDNRDDLIAALEIPDPAIGDGPLILKAYERWADHCPEHLLGDFAFAIWDARRQALFCARDHMGIKPIYYYHRPGHLFAFASEIKALLSLPQVPRQLNELRIGDYLVPILDDKEVTFYRGILRLPPGHSLTVSPERLSIQSYWSLDPHREVRFGSDQDYAEAFREHLREAVRCRLRSAFPVGSMLSGGLDSSSITCMARDLPAKNWDGRLHTFSAIFDDVPECDERPFIDAVLAQGRLDAHYVHPDRIGPLNDVDRVLWHEDEPFSAPNLFMHWALYDEAHRHGIRVLLDGFDGDTTVSHGVSHLTALTRRGQWLSLAREISSLSQNFHCSAWTLIKGYVVRPFAPDPLLKVWRTMKGRNVPSWGVNPTIRPDFARSISLAERIKAIQGEHVNPPRSAREEHYRRLTWGMISLTLEVANRASAAFALESRYPFFDRRLVEFCLGLPPEQKLLRGWTRMIMRRGLASILPEAIRWRAGKTNFKTNFIRGLLHFDRQRVEDMILNNSSVIAPYVDVAVLREVYRRFVTGQANADALTVWKAVTLGLWLRQTALRP